MKKIIIAIIALALVAAALPAQGLTSSIGAAYVMQNFSYDYYGMDESFTLHSLALNIEVFSGSLIGVYMSAAFGMTFGGQFTQNDIAYEMDMDVFDTTIVMSTLLGIGGKIELGPISLTAGIGADVEMAMLMSSDYYVDSFDFMGVGPGAGATATLSLGGGLGVYAGLRASYLMLEFMETIDADFVGGLSIVPHAGISLKR